MSLQEHNDKLVELFEQEKPFSLVRIGCMEGYFLESYFHNREPHSSQYVALYYAAGVYPANNDYYKHIWQSKTLQAIQNSDMVGFVDIPETIKNNKQFLNLNCPDVPLFFKDDIGILNPNTLLAIDNPWTKKLTRKKVLVISSHKDSILHQWNNINHVWKENIDTVTPFELVDVIRSPFNPELDDRQYDNCSTWEQSLTSMQNLISEYDFDVLLVGAGAYSPNLAVYAKSIGKIGITLCGDIQLFFGILGTRWESLKSDSSKDSWIYPLKSDLPQKQYIFDSIEKAYW